MKSSFLHHRCLPINLPDPRPHPGSSGLVYSVSMAHGGRAASFSARFPAAAYGCRPWKTDGICSGLPQGPVPPSRGPHRSRSQETGRHRWVADNRVARSFSRLRLGSGFRAVYGSVLYFPCHQKSLCRIHRSYQRADLVHRRLKLP